MEELSHLRTHDGSASRHLEEKSDSISLGYQVPQTGDHYVPKFDEDLERKALGFKEAV